MTLEEEFEEIMFHSLVLLNDEIIVPYIIKCFYTLSNFITEKTSESIRFTYDNTDKILQGFYRIGIENCQEKYNYYTSILEFKEQFIENRQLMVQIRNNWLHNQICNFYESQPKIIPLSDKEFYVKKYKFYNSFKITLS